MSIAKELTGYKTLSYSENNGNSIEMRVYGRIERKGIRGVPKYFIKHQTFLMQRVDNFKSNLTVHTQIIAKLSKKTYLKNLHIFT